MKQAPKDPIREERIHDEAIVDAYGPEEQAMGWYYYLESKLTFPFMARCAVSRTVSPLKKGELLEVRRMAPEDNRRLALLGSPRLPLLNHTGQDQRGNCS